LPCIRTMGRTKSLSFHITPVLATWRKAASPSFVTAAMAMSLLVSDDGCTELVTTTEYQLTANKLAGYLEQDHEP